MLDTKMKQAAEAERAFARANASISAYHALLVSLCGRTLDLPTAIGDVRLDRLRARRDREFARLLQEHSRAGSACIGR